MSICPESDIHSVYLDGELPQEFLKDYETHVSSCAKCSRELEKFRKLRNVFSDDKKSISFSKEEIDESFERLQAKLSYARTMSFNEKKRKINWGEYFKYGIVGVAASLAVMLVSTRQELNRFRNDSFQPVSRNSASYTANQIRSDGNVNITNLNAILASDGKTENSVYTISIPANRGNSKPMFIMIGNPYGENRYGMKSQLAGYDVFCPPTEDFDRIVDDGKSFGGMPIKFSE